MYATLGKHLPDGAVRNIVELDVADGETINGVLNGLNVPLEHCHLVLVDGVYVAPSERDDHVLQDAQALAVWPPVAGG
ncbi:MAG: MoaD/ThiS family protein [Rhodospirillaceae bacterium]|nr:MoaD/ThiS family protein [Rhodospirillaceae bacterium]